MRGPSATGARSSTGVGRAKTASIPASRTDGRPNPRHPRGSETACQTCRRSPPSFPRCLRHLPRPRGPRPVAPCAARSNASAPWLGPGCGSSARSPASSLRARCPRLQRRSVAQRGGRWADTGGGQDTGDDHAAPDAATMRTAAPTADRAPLRRLGQGALRSHRGVHRWLRHHADVRRSGDVRAGPRADLQRGADRAPAAAPPRPRSRPALPQSPPSPAPICSLAWTSTACRAIPGMRELGAACATDTQCASTGCRLEPGAACGTCQPVVGAGEPCTDARCQPGLFCAAPSMACATPGAVDAACRPGATPAIPASTASVPTR